MRTIATILLLLAAGAAFAAAIATRSRVGHPVSPRMREAAGAQAGRPATSLPEEVRGKAAVLIFIQEGCPCSEAAEPCFRRLARAYGSRIAFLGIIDGDATIAERWIREHDTPYPVLADPDLKLIRSLSAERSAYVTLVTPGGTVERLWPGYSGAMLRELGTRLATLTEMAEVPLDAGDAPEELTSGCPFN